MTKRDVTTSKTTKTVVKKKEAPAAKTGGISVQQLAKQIGIPVERLLTQLQSAKISASGPEDILADDAKEKLLHYLQTHHGAKSDAAPEKIVLRRAKTSEIKITSGHGVGKTVSVQVRKKRTYVKRPAQEEEQKKQLELETKQGKAGLEAKQFEGEQSEVLDVLKEETPPTLEASSERVEEIEPSVQGEVPAGETAAPEVPGQTEAEKAKAGEVKRKEKRVGDEFELEDSEEERRKKKKKARTATRSPTTGPAFEKLLRHGGNLKIVLNQSEEEETEHFRRRGGKGRKGASSQGAVQVQAFTRPTAPMIHEVSIPETMSIADLAQKMSVKAADLIKTCIKLGIMVTINQVIDQETAILVVEEMGHKAKAVSSQALEEELIKDLKKTEGELKPRSPVITIMGHVDHGKTTLLDYIRRTKVAAQEAGGITQHIGAYHVETPKGGITFLDTPGHAAFTAMRARGAKLTDIVVLVVAADDGAMPQTVEAIQHAKAANVPLVVAVNKIDKHGADPDRIKQELSKHGLLPEEWGGDTMFVPISAKTGQNVDNLLDAVLLQSEMMQLKAVPEGYAKGVVIESRLDKGRGPVASVLIQQGVLSKGDIVLAGFEYGRARALFDELGKQVEKAGPSIPVEILGLSSTPQAGDDFMVVPDEKRAREVAAFRLQKHREAQLAKQGTPKLEDLMQRMGEEKEEQVLNLILKADVQGSVEALQHALSELSTPEIRAKVISSGVGGIRETDVNLAIASQAVIIGFNVRADIEARKRMEGANVIVHYHNIIYDVINQVKRIMSGYLAPDIQEKVVGVAEVREVFRSSKTGSVAGCMVLEGVIKRNQHARLLRDGVVVYEGGLESLRRFKDDVSEVRNGLECGIVLKDFNDVKASDQIEIFERTEIKREIA